MSGRLFRSFFLGGFECSSHRLACGRRLDMVAATGHDRHVTSDYLRLREQGIRTAREGVRWPLVEPSPGRYDFSSVLPILRAARRTGVEIIWDLFHYGWPDDIDIFSPEFVRRLGLLARAFARVLAGEGDDAPWLVPVNEISFLAWTGGEVGRLNPFAVSRGLELKRQLVRAAIEAIESAWAVVPSARIVHVDPIFHVVADPDRPHEADAAEAYRRVAVPGAGHALRTPGARTRRRSQISRRHRGELLSLEPVDLQRTDRGRHDDRPHGPRLPAVPGHAARASRAIRPAAAHRRDGHRRRRTRGVAPARGPRGPRGHLGEACRSGGSACTRSSTSPAGTTSAIATTASGITRTRRGTAKSTVPSRSSCAARGAGSSGWGVPVPSDCGADHEDTNTGRIQLLIF